MPTRDPRLALQTADIETVVAETCFPDERNATVPGQVGLEVERVVVVHDGAGRPAGRVHIDDGEPNSLAVLAGLEAPVLDGRCDVAGVPSFPVLGGGRLTFEPGGVLEHATAVHATATEALAEVEALGPVLASSFDEHRVSLASVGVDPWHDVDTIPLQLDCYRYPAMAAYLARRGTEGLIMMRHSASVQVNLDLGGRASVTERWDLANLLSPVLTATFANAPGAGAVGGRARAWQRLDPTRTGFPPGFVDGSVVDPVKQMVEAALEADVLLVRTGRDEALAGSPGWTFRRWIEHGHDSYGRPTADDLRYHLSTLFHEVRARGSLEFRAVDAIPHRWRPVPVVLLCGALEDATARSRLLDLLLPRRAQLPVLWRQAASTGVRDPSMCALAVEVWSYALEGAGRLPAGYLPAGSEALAEEFLEEFTLRGRCPADELRARLVDGPASSLAWTAEPVAEHVRRGR